MPVTGVFTKRRIIFSAYITLDGKEPYSERGILGRETKGTYDGLMNKDRLLTIHYAIYINILQSVTVLYHAELSKLTEKNKE